MTEQTVKPRPAPPAPTKITVRFFLKHGTMVEWTPAAGPFSLTAFVTNIRASGFFFTDDVYIPAEEIACIGLGAGTSTKVVQPQHGRVQ